MSRRSRRLLGSGPEAGSDHRFRQGAWLWIEPSCYDAAVSGADPVTERPGFLAMLQRIAGNGIRTIIVESPDRFARDLAVQLAGHDMLKGLGIDLIPASAPDFFLEDTPTAVLVRQVLGAIAQFEKASLVAKLRPPGIASGLGMANARAGGRTCEMNPELVALAKRLRRRNPKTGERKSLRAIAAELERQGYVNIHGRPFAAESIKAMSLRR